MPARRRLLRPHELLITCEHGGNRVPLRYRSAFTRAGRALASHEGYDPGALQLARDFARELDAPLYFSTTSRLLIELNSSLWHPRCFSRYSKRLPLGARLEIIERHYLPYRDSVKAHVARALKRARRVVHLSCHSFTPRLAGVTRQADIGLLFDPRRDGEASFCAAWQRALGPSMHVRRNYPYKGSDDGLTTELRARFGARYLGIELEVNQRFPKGDPARWRRVRRALVESFCDALRR
jgi:predicted N-formylglutamate amidohydrolase